MAHKISNVCFKQNDLTHSSGLNYPEATLLHIPAAAARSVPSGLKERALMACPCACTAARNSHVGSNAKTATLENSACWTSMPNMIADALPAFYVMT